MSWAVKRTDTFLKNLKKHKTSYELLKELDVKIKSLEQNPENIGGYLRGKLSGNKSTRLSSKFRLIFEVDTEKRIVYLKAIGHRGKIY